MRIFGWELVSVRSHGICGWLTLVTRGGAVLDSFLFFGSRLPARVTRKAHDGATGDEDSCKLGIDFSPHSLET